ncbi:MAG: VWA domain-containing protein, partial [Pirellulaceae bacterium]|nr:VWA domain-containing protein [Pirellulaceae bacterium]
LMRALAVLMFGLALAQPFFSARQSEFDGQQPLHAILLVDNSRSMGYLSLEGSLLDVAKDSARRFIDRLPDGSRIHVIPVCGSDQGASPDPYDTKDHAIDALKQVRVVDRPASIQEAVNRAQRAHESAPQLSKRLVMFTDQQARNWQGVLEKARFEELPDMQIVETAAGEWANTWISSIKIQDGLADVETPTTILVQLRHQGTNPRYDFEVKLEVDGEPVATQTITMEPNSARELVFQHVFQSQSPEPGRPSFVPVTASISPDRLPADDRLSIVASVVAALPVVFVDQHGADGEDSIQNRFGETRHLRQLLAPRVSRQLDNRQLIRIRHIRPEQISRESLADARLVVIAGVNAGDSTDILREYVQQGGQLLIAAGADFQPQAWSDEWRDGAGVLPAPLLAEFVGSTPEEAVGQLDPFFFSFESLQAHDYFRLAGESEEQARDLFAEPLFFKAVQVDMDDQVLQQLQAAETSRVAERFAVRRAFAALQEQQDDPTQSLDSETARQYRDLHPQWLVWKRTVAADDTTEMDDDELKQEVERLVQAGAPTVLAALDNGSPLLVERRIDNGRVIFFSSGLLSGWNTLPQTNCVIVFDRILRTMIQDTLPTRDFLAGDELPIAVLPVDREVSVQLSRPGSESPEVIHRGFIDQDLLVPHPLTAGVYKLTALSSDSMDDETESVDSQLWNIHFAVHCVSEESELTPLDRAKFDELGSGSGVRWLGPNDTISLAGSQVRGQDSWWWLTLGILLLLLIELGILSAPEWRAPAASAEVAA